MADLTPKTINELPEASSLSSGDLLPVSSSGASKKVLWSTIKSIINSAYGNKNVKFVCGTARYYNGEWILLNNANHNPLGLTIASGQTNPTTFTVGHDVGATKVLSLVCGPDEGYAKQSVICGASVGLTESIINVVAPYVGASSVSNSGGASTYSHSVVLGDTDIIYSVLEQTSGTLGKYLKIGLTSAASVSSILNLFSTNEYDWKVLGYSSDYINVQPYLNGVKQTLPLSAGKVSFSIMKQVYGMPSIISHTNCNIWILGIFEVA